MHLLSVADPGHLLSVGRIFWRLILKSDFQDMNRAAYLIASDINRCTGEKKYQFILF